MSFCHFVKIVTLQQFFTHLLIFSAHLPISPIAWTMFVCIFFNYVFFQSFFNVSPVLYTLDSSKNFMNLTNVCIVESKFLSTNKMWEIWEFFLDLHWVKISIIMDCGKGWDRINLIMESSRKRVEDIETICALT